MKYGRPLKGWDDGAPVAEGRSEVNVGFGEPIMVAECVLGILGSRPMAQWEAA